MRQSHAGPQSHAVQGSVQRGHTVLGWLYRLKQALLLPKIVSSASGKGVSYLSAELVEE